MIVSSSSKYYDNTIDEIESNMSKIQLVKIEKIGRKRKKTEPEFVPSELIKLVVAFLCNAAWDAAAVFTLCSTLYILQTHINSNILVC